MTRTSTSPNPSSPAVNRHVRHETAALVTVELDRVQQARQPDDLSDDMQAGLCERALERAELLAVTVRIDEHVLDQLIELSFRPR